VAARTKRGDVYTVFVARTLDSDRRLPGSRSRPLERSDRYDASSEEETGLEASSLFMRLGP
jgi:hypothetical protein